MSDLWKHQQIAVERARTTKCFGLFFDLGTGKSRTAIQILRERFTDNKRLLRTLIISPPITLRNWYEEWLKYSKVAPQDVTVLYGEGKKRVSLFNLKSKRDDIPVGHIFITNYESLLMTGLYEKLLVWKPEAMVLDEMHRIKSLSSKRTKAALKLSETAVYRYGLTGSPVLNSVMDIFPQALYLDRGQALGTNQWVFRARHMRDKNAGMPKQRYFPDWIPLPGAEESIHESLKHITMHVHKSECLDLPPLVKQTYYVDMTEDQKKMYLEMKQDFLTFIDGKEVVATMAMTKLLRLQQMASGFARDVDGEDHEIPDSPKLAALEELLETICVKDKVIVWAAWRANYVSIAGVCKKLGLEYRELHGGTSPTGRFEIVEDFCKNPDIKVLIANQGAAGIGINLVEAGYSIYYSRNFSLEQDIQSEARNYRAGSELHTRVTRIDLVTRGTVDELVADSLAKKQDMGTKVLVGIKDKI